VVGLVVAFASCRDFEEAYLQCVDAGTCIPDGTGDGGRPDGGNIGTDGGNTGTDSGTPDSGTPDSGTPDSGTIDIPDSGTINPPDSGTIDTLDSGTIDTLDSGTIDSGMLDSGTPDTTDSGTPDAGPFTPVDSGTMIADAGATLQALEVNGCTDDLCLRHKYTLKGPYEFQGLWGSSPDDVFLAARARPEFQAPAQVVRFHNGRFAATTVDLPGFQPFRLQGTDSANVWAINEAPASGPCWLGNEPLANPGASPLLHCPSPVFRFDGQSWAPVAYAIRGEMTIQPPALYTGPESTWVASSDQGVLRWTGGTWQQESTLLGPGDQLSALWGDTSEPRLGVGGDSHQLAAFRQRTAWGTWAQASSMASDPFVAIAGPDEKNLYAATASEVLRRAPGDWWQTELTAPQLNGQTPKVQDIWVSADGSDVWVTLQTSYVLRKHQGEWSVVHLPVAPGFAALQVEGFNTPRGDLWITGTEPSGPFFATVAYHYERLEP
jgi:hypothetical protein